MDPAKIPMRLTVTGAVAAGNTLQAVLLIGHPMESGFRTMESGQRIAKNVIESVQVFLGSQKLFDMQTGIGISSNPYMAFPVQLPTPWPPAGLPLRVTWQDDKGQRGAIERALI
jgi:sulfur-oxidizing protein SoxZ